MTDLDLEPSSMRALLERQVMDAHATAGQALEDAATAEGYWTAAAATAMAFDLTARLIEVQHASYSSDVEFLTKAAELDLKRAEVTAKRMEIMNERAKANMDIEKAQQEIRKMQAEVQEIEIRVDQARRGEAVH